MEVTTRGIDASNIAKGLLRINFEQASGDTRDWNCSFSWGAVSISRKLKEENNSCGF